MKFNVIGHISAEIGLGIMAADLVRALSERGHEVRALDVELGLNRKGRSHDLDHYCVSESQLYADGVDLLVFPISAVDHWKRYEFGARRVAIPLWELPDVNSKWIAGLRAFDDVWAPSDFIADTLERAGLKVWRAPWPHYLPLTPSRQEHAASSTLSHGEREKFGLPADRVVFTFAFDPSSDVQRKNPQAIVEAFLQADEPQSLLCIQVNRSAENFAALDDWLRALPPDRVCVINRHLSHGEAVQLIACSDVYISLHRAEGLGLGMLEAMMVGTPVIATAWSGNLAFMNSDSACLVDADLVPLSGTIPAYTQREIGVPSKWAAPHVANAAQWIAALMNESLRRRKSVAALEHARTYQTAARRLEWIEQLKPPTIAVTRPADVIKRLLIFTPTWIDPDQHVAAIHPKCRAMIEAQRMSADMQWAIGLENPYPIPDHRNVLHQYQLARQVFLAGEYDALLTIEHDNVLPDVDAVQRLLDTPGDVIYAPYLLRHGAPVLNTWQYIGARGLGMPLDHYPDELKRARKAVRWRISGAGMGCTLFRRRALETIGFEASGDNNPCPDLGFALAAGRAGFESYARMDVPVAHYSRGKWLIPFQEQGMKYLAIETGQTSVDGKIIRLVKGAPVALNEDEAGVLRSLGKIGEVIPEAPVAPAHVIVDANDDGVTSGVLSTETHTPPPARRLRQTRKAE